MPLIRTKNLQADQRVPKLAQCLSTAIRTVIQVLLDSELNHQTGQVSDSDCVIDENNSSSYGSSFTAHGSFWNFHSDH